MWAGVARVGGKGRRVAGMGMRVENARAPWHLRVGWLVGALHGCRPEARADRSGEDSNFRSRQSCCRLQGPASCPLRPDNRASRSPPCSSVSSCGVRACGRPEATIYCFSPEKSRRPTPRPILWPPPCEAVTLGTPTASRRTYSASASASKPSRPGPSNDPGKPARGRRVPRPPRPLSTAAHGP